MHQTQRKYQKNTSFYKVRAIAKKEDLFITTIFEVGLKMAVQSYEAKNGPIRVRQNKKKEIDDVFGL